MASAAPNVDLFDAYFRRADLDRDGRISGAEAVSFFQGSGLPKHVLAQIWAFANQSQSGFLGRAEFYNALKLVTVAQSKRELTPEMVKAALYGPAASKIPAPQINFSATVAPPVSAPAPPASPVNPLSHQNLGPRGAVPNLSVNRQNLPSLGSQLGRPPASNLPPGVVTQGMAVGGARPETLNLSGYGSAGKMGEAQELTSSPIAVRGISLTQEGFGPATSGSNAARPPGQYPASSIKPSDQIVKDSKPGTVNGNAPDSFFGGDLFSASSFQPKQVSPTQGYSSGSSVLSSAIVPVSEGNQPSIRTTSTDSLQSSLVSHPFGAQLQKAQPVSAQLQQVQPVGAQLQQAQAVVKQDQHVPVQTHNMLNSSGLPRRLQDSASSQPQSPWPKMAQTDVQKYMKVFMEVDTDRDGKITGEQARNLFLSWRLPREVLKQVWDLSDQDNDSMLSLREFCIALYLMERHREGRVLPAVLPSNIMVDLPTSGQPAAPYSAVPWGNPSGFQQQGMTGSGARQVNPASGRPPRPAAVSQSDEGPQNKPQKSRIPVLEKHLINQLSSDEQNSINSKFQEATEADKKVEELEKEIAESKEKIDFCRAKMQELVLYKSRCDNRLNEVIERISADKHEVEILAKKYENKYKQVGDLSSKLTTEEATFRDIQEKKIELYQAIVKMEQDEKGDETLQARVDRIQTDLDELVKSLNERCKKYGLRAKPTTLLELPFGWQPGIQEGAADWDEDWDKLEDKEYVFVKELTLDVQNTIAPPKQKLPSAVNTKAVNTEAANTKAVNTEAVNTDSPTFAASPRSDDKSEKPQTTNEQVGNGSVYNKSEDGSAKSAPSSPFASSAIGSPHGDFADSDFRKTTGEDSSPRDHTIQEPQSDRGDVKSVFSGDKSFDEPNWGTFDANDDIDSVWGFNANSTTKEERDFEGVGDNYFFDSGELGLNPIKTGSPQVGDPVQRNSGFSFDDSVPSTPLFNSSSSPQRPKEWLETAFDFSRFDSFRTHDSVPLPAREATEQFDSVRNSVDFDHVHGFPAFDDSDLFGSGPFRTSTDSQTPRRGSDSWSAF
ncbi:epidermal growth factor receptor substrate 15-like 1 [Vigna radiata var. radiata]|uniref:Epidermal growth factor receptor substrate 15-like 1 n=1 Tax=Vigna radiata var. radiata TaxID=3916 RepID=A0A1S3UEY6_VIGRR|nr:epidermal growth factor receptor substrate 15-like 1 [Vigna radiata var. radiata]